MSKKYTTNFLEDTNGSTGSANQVLISTAAGIDWVDGSGSAIIGGPYLPLVAGSGNPLTGDLYINDDVPSIILNDTNATSPTNTAAYISFRSQGTQQGYIGYGSGSNNDIALYGASGSDAVIYSGAGLALTLDTSQNATFTGDVTVIGKTTIEDSGSVQLDLRRGSLGQNGNTSILFTQPLGNGYIGVDATGAFSYNIAANLTASKFKVDRSGNTTISGDLTVSGGDITLGGATGRIQGIDTISSGTDAVNRDYVDTEIGNIPSGLAFEGNWNASTDTPTLAGTTQDNGKFWIVSVAGTTNLSGITDWAVGDWAIYVDNGAGTDAWQKVDNSSTLSGLGAANKVAFWSTTANVSFNNNFSYDGTYLTSPRIRVGDGTDGYFYSDSAGRTAFAGGQFYIQDTVGTYYNYATNQYHGASSGDNHYFRGNPLSGNNWSITAAGEISAASTITASGGFLVPYTPGTKKPMINLVGATNYGLWHTEASNDIFSFDFGGVSKQQFFQSGNATFAGDLTVSGGDIVLGGTGRIQGVDTVSATTDAANKAYVDNAIAGVPQGDITAVIAGSGLNGGGTSGSVTLNAVSLPSFDTRSTNPVPNTTSNGVRYDFKSNSTNGLSDGGTYNGQMTWRSYSNTTDLSGGMPINIAYTANGNLWTRIGASATTWGTWYKLWSSGNDGAGSGLDADLLDGQQGSYYASAASIGNGQIDGRTSGLGLSGSMDATANQSGNTTFTVTSNATTAATANTIAYRNSSADIRARLFRSNYQNQSTISGGIAYRVNNGADDYIRFCTDKGAIRTFLGVPASGDLNNYLLNTTDTLTGSLSVTAQVITDSITLTGTFYSRVSNSTLALQRMDTRVDATNYSRTHWYGISDTGATSNFRHAYYDGANYINVTAASGRLTFAGKVAGSTPTAAGDLATKAYVDNAVAGVPQGDITAVTAGTFLTGGGTSGDVTLNADASKLAHIVDSSNGSVTSGWITVAQASTARRAGEVYVTDGESSDHSYIRIEWMRSYADSNFTVINCGGHANRIQGVRVLEETGDTTYGRKYLQVKVTATSNYYVIVTAPGTIPNYTDLTAVTPVLENSKTGYNIKGNTLEDLQNSSIGSEQGITSGGNIELNDARYVFTKGDVLSLSAGGAGVGTEIVLDDAGSVIKLNSDTIALGEFKVSSLTDGTGNDVFRALVTSSNSSFSLGDIEGLGDGSYIVSDGTTIKLRNNGGINTLVTDNSNNVEIPNGNLLISNQIGVNTTNFNPQAGIIVNGNQTFGTPGGGTNVNSRYLSIEGGADGAGEGSGRIFFTEHNSTTAAMDNYGMSLGYRGGPTSIVGASGETWSGLSQIGNGEWGMWGHNNSANGALIMHGDRAATYVDFSGNNIQGITDAYIADQIIHTGDTNTYMQFHAADQWRVVTGGAERLEINNSAVTVNATKFIVNDFVGIGVTSPTNQLHVHTATDNNYAIRIEGSTNNGAGVWTGLGIGGEANNTKSAILFEDIGENYSRGKLHLCVNNSQNQNSATTADAKLTVSNDGKIGIGTTSPNAPLHITGPAPVATQALLKLERSSPVVDYLDTSSSGYFLLTESFKNVSGTTIGSRQVMQNPGGSGLYYNFDNGASGGSQHRQKQNSFHWTINSNSEKLTLGTNGYLGVNDTSPSYQLDVNGSGRFTSTVTATNFILSSDERLKENIEKVRDNGVEVDWKTFELKADKGQKRYGVIAQELEKTNPEFVREGADGFKSVAYIDLLIAKIAELEARLEKLEK